MKTNFVLTLIISLLIVSKAFAQSQTLSYEGDCIYIDNCLYGNYLIDGTMCADHIKINNPSDLDAELYEKYTSVFSFFSEGKRDVYMRYEDKDQYGNLITKTKYLCSINIDEIKKYKTYRDWNGKNGIFDAYWRYRAEIIKQCEQQKEREAREWAKTHVTFSTAEEKKDENFNTIFSFRITNNSDKEIAAIKFTYTNDKFGFMSAINTWHHVNKKITLPPQYYMDYNFKIYYNPEDEGCNYRLIVSEIIYKDGSFDKYNLQLTK